MQVPFWLEMHTALLEDMQPERKNWLKNVAFILWGRREGVGFVCVLISVFTDISAHRPKCCGIQIE